MVRRWLFVLTALPILLVLVGCSSTTTPSVSEVVIDQGDVVLEVGQTTALSATVRAVGGASTDVMWASGDEAVATVSDAGLVSAVAVGEATVVATSAFDDSRSASVTVTVVASGDGDPVGVSVSVEPRAVTLEPGASQEFTATVVGAQDASVEWSASGGSVVPSGSTAVFTAPAEVGEYTVTATSVADPSKSAVATVTVTVAGGGPSLTPPSGVSLARVEDGVLLQWRFDQVAAGLVFEVQRAVGGGAFVDLAVVPAVELEYLDESVSSGVLHSYRVRARSDAAVSVFSSVVAHQEEVVSVPPDEYAFVGIEDDGVGVAVSGLTLVSDGMVAVSAFAEPSAPVDRPVIAPVVRLVVSVADLDLDADEPLWVMLPPHEDFVFGSDDAVWALVRVTGASGVVVEFSAVYSMNYAPVAVEMGMLRAVQVWEGLPEWVEIEVIPLLTPSLGASASASAEAGVLRAPVIEHLRGLHRLDGSAQRASMAAECEGVLVSSFPAARAAFGATLVGAQPQQTWTTESGKRPLVLIHGIQSFAHAEADLDGEDARIAAGLCVWQDFIAEFQQDPRLSERFTLYVFGYDSVMTRVRVNGHALERELNRAFGGGEVFVVAHSMGGMVTRDAMTRGAIVAQLYSLGTPYRGSAGVECIKANRTECEQVTNTITYDSVLRMFARAAIHSLQYPGVKDTAFEVAFKTHSHACKRCRQVFGVDVCAWWVCKSDNVPNPYLQSLPAPTPATAFTSFVGNVLDHSGRSADDSLGGYKFASREISQAIGDFLGRFNDNIVSVGSAAFLNLHSELTLTYAELGTLSDRSPFHSVVLAPCFDHSMLTTLKELRMPPTGTSCGSAAQFPGDEMTVFGWIAADILKFSTTVSIAPSTSTISVNGNQQFTATVTGAVDTSVTWDATCGSISGSGNTVRYTAPATASTCTVTAASVADASASASATVTVLAVAEVGTLKWELHFNAHDARNEFGWFTSAASIGSDGIIYFKSAGHKLFALNGDGELQWEYEVAPPGVGWNDSAPVIASDGTIYATSVLELHAITPGGEQAWVFPFDSSGSGYYYPALGHDGTIYLAPTGRRRFYAINPDGSVKWVVELEQGNFYSVHAVADDGTLYVGCGTDLSALCAFGPDGDLRWQVAVGGASASLALGHDGTVYAVPNSSSPALVAVDPAGVVKWQFEMPYQYVLPSPAVVGSDGVVYVGGSSGVFYAVNEDGSLRWQVEVSNRGPLWPSIGADGTVYVTGRRKGSGNTFYGLIDAFDSAGNVLWSDEVFGSEFGPPALGGDGVLYVGDLHRIRAYQTASLGYLDSPWPTFQRDNSNSGRAE